MGPTKKKYTRKDSIRKYGIGFGSPHREITSPAPVVHDAQSPAPTKPDKAADTTQGIKLGSSSKVRNSPAHTLSVAASTSPEKAVQDPSEMLSSSSFLDSLLQEPGVMASKPMTLSPVSPSVQSDYRPTSPTSLLDLDTYNESNQSAFTFNTSRPTSPGQHSQEGFLPYLHNIPSPSHTPEYMKEFPQDNFDFADVSPPENIDFSDDTPPNSVQPENTADKRDMDPIDKVLQKLASARSKQHSESQDLCPKPKNDLIEQSKKISREKPRASSPTSTLVRPSESYTSHEESTTAEPEKVIQEVVLTIGDQRSEAVQSLHKQIKTFGYKLIGLAQHQIELQDEAACELNLSYVKDIQVVADDLQILAHSVIEHSKIMKENTLKRKRELDEMAVSKKRDVHNLSGDSDSSSCEQAPAKKRKVDDQQEGSTMQKQSYANVTGVVQVVAVGEAKPKMKYYCKVCSKVFVNKRNLKLHLINHTSLGLKCSYCYLKFTSKALLDKHQQSHADHKYKCKYCNEELNSATSLHNHQKRHVQGGKFTCDICHKVLSHKQNYDDHMEFKHKEGKHNPCDLCEFRSKTRKGLRQHKYKMHFDREDKIIRTKSKSKTAGKRTEK